MAAATSKLIPMKTMGFMSGNIPDLPEPPKPTPTPRRAAAREDAAKPSGPLRGYDRPLTPAEVADYLRITPACARKWAREGKIPSVKIGTKIWIPAGEFYEMMRIGGTVEAVRP